MTPERPRRPGEHAHAPQPFTPTQQLARNFIYELRQKVPGVEAWVVMASPDGLLEIGSEMTAARELALVERLLTVLPTYEASLRKMAKEEP